MMIFKKTIPRRTFLRGAGVAIGLPLLEGMMPALAATEDPSVRSPRRLAFVYFPNGVIVDKWVPRTTGAKFEISPILEPLTPFRDHMVVVSGLSHLTAHRLPDEPGGDHSRASATWLSGVHPKRTEGSDLRGGISADQVAAQELGKHTQLASLEISLDNTDLLGGCEAGYSCAYMNTLCWRSPTTPLPMENQPRAVFERLFGDSDNTDPSARLARIQEDRSVLDLVTKHVYRLKKELSTDDGRKISEYLDAIRDIERRIQMAEEQSARELPSLERPAGVPVKFDDYARLMYDMQLVAFQSDLTRVSTLCLSREQNNRAYTEIGITEPHHALSHHFGDAKKIDQMVQINLFHVKLFAYFLEKMRTTPDGDGSLLDHSLILYGSGLSDGNLHSHDNLPVLLVGGGGQLKGGNHLSYPTDTPMMNLFLTMLDKVGVPIDQLGDSTGKLDLLSL